uniref:Serine/threonine-protein phosphatase 4 regulatory subunit 2 n=1 Tax=Eutreptiella gymnastica TaxID=73025 RepID=A0A7S1IQQ1_9EUGL|mmetsp:Transcript_36297/g.64970  ORF Transcript_36297/g.64970 Transcript_36297/m.64970 type:complete len:162 (+) Transcript_36297:118-603(+)
MTTKEEGERFQGALGSWAGELNKDINDLIIFLAQTGCNCFNWDSLKPVLIAKVKSVSGTDESQECNELRNDILMGLQGFTAAPFTLQRLCELLAEPHAQHSTTEKLLFAMAKLTNVSSSLEAQLFPYQEPSESQAMDSSEVPPVTSNAESENAADQMDICT